MKILSALALASMFVSTVACAAPSDVKIVSLKFKSGGFWNDSKVRLTIDGPSQQRKAAALRASRVNVNPGRPEGGGSGHVYRVFGKTHINFTSSSTLSREAGLGGLLQALYPTETPEQRLQHLPERKVRDTPSSSLVQYRK